MLSLVVTLLKKQLIILRSLSGLRKNQTQNFVFSCATRESKPSHPACKASLINTIE